MKATLLVTAVMALVIGCATFPAPKDENTALVVGRLSLDFPDGFFRQSPRSIRYGVTVRFYDVTRGTTFSATTHNSYYYFLSSGTDTYRLVTYEYREHSGAGHVTLHGQEIMRDFVAQQGKVIYLGDITYTYASPEIAKSEVGGTRQTWNYAVSRDERSDLGGLREYLREKDASEAWLEREIVEIKPAK